MPQLKKYLFDSFQVVSVVTYYTTVPSIQRPWDQYFHTLCHALKEYYQLVHFTQQGSDCTIL